MTALALVLTYAWTQPLWAQAQNNCNISLPHRLEQISSCTPQSAAAYDLAFCAVSYAGAEEPFKSKAAAYFKISQGLTDTDTLAKNVDLAKKYYQSQRGAEGRVSPQALEYVRQKCSSIETHHAKVLTDLAKKLKLQPY